MNIFTYGSLMFASVIEALTKGHFEFEEITIKDFERLSISGKKYPGIRQKAGSFVSGRIWFDIDSSSMKILDLFEDSLYEKQTLEIVSDSRGLINTYAYVVPKHLEKVLADEPWDPKVFENEHLDQYVEMCRRFRLENIEQASH